MKTKCFHLSLPVGVKVEVKLLRFVLNLSLLNVIVLFDYAFSISRVI